MTFQRVRGAMAKLTSEGLALGGIPLADQAFDNVQESPGKDAAGAYAVVSISFPQTVVEAIGCEGADLIVGTCNVLVYAPRQQGMVAAEAAMQAVLKEWVRVNMAAVNYQGVHLRTRGVSGPNTLAPDQRPHQAVQLSCSFTARVD